MSRKRSFGWAPRYARRLRESEWAEACALARLRVYRKLNASRVLAMRRGT